MPKSAYDFSREMLFYMIKCNDETITSIYVGSTFDFIKRKSSHKSMCKKYSRCHHLKIYQTICENGGWGNWNMNVIERKIVLDNIEAKQIEQMLIDKYKADLNMYKAYRTLNEIVEYNQTYKNTHMDITSKNNKEYNSKNHDIILKKKKEFRDNNKDAIREYQKQYREKNKETNATKRAEYNTEYFKANKDAINERRRLKNTEKKAQASSI